LGKLNFPSQNVWSLPPFVHLPPHHTLTQWNTSRHSGSQEVPWMFVTVFTGARHGILSWASSI
jgi:hypothetical protein